MSRSNNIPVWSSGNDIIDSGISITAVGNTFIDTSIKTANYTLSNNDNALFDLSGASGNITATLPVSPADKTKVKMTLITANSNNNYNVIIDRGANNFMVNNDTRFYDLVMSGESLELTYYTNKWLITNKQLNSSTIKNLYVGSNVTAAGGIVYTTRTNLGNLISNTGSFTIRRKGYYQFRLTCNAYIEAGATDLMVQLNKNGSTVRELYFVRNSSGYTAGVASRGEILDVAQGDVIQLVSVLNSAGRYLFGISSFPLAFEAVEFLCYN